MAEPAPKYDYAAAFRADLREGLFPRETVLKAARDHLHALRGLTPSAERDHAIQDFDIFIRGEEDR